MFDRLTRRLRRLADRAAPTDPAERQSHRTRAQTGSPPKWQSAGVLPEGTVADLLKPENKAKLTAILTYHVVAGKDMAKDVSGLSSVKTVNGKELSVKVVDGKVIIGNATVTTADIGTSNGVIHVIDTVLLP